MKDTTVNKIDEISLFWELPLYKERQITNKQIRQCRTELSEVHETRQCDNKALLILDWGIATQMYAFVKTLQVVHLR